MNDELSELWRSAGGAAPAEPSLEDVMERAEELERKVRRANAREYVAGAFVIVFFAVLAAGALHLPFLSRLGAAAIACACVFIVTYLRLRGAARTPSPEEPTLAFLRGELARRRDLLARVHTWYLAPFVPGLVMFLAGVWLATRHVPGATRSIVLSTIVVVAVNAGIVLVNRRAVAALDREIASLEDPERSA
jgi:hypothetical protein